MKSDKVISTIAKNWDKAREENRKSSYAVRAYDFGFKRFQIAIGNRLESITIPSSTNYITIKI